MKVKIENNSVYMITYPFLGAVYDDSHLRFKIVYFIKFGEGIVVFNNKDSHKVGTYSNDWVMTAFEKFNGSIILEND